MPIKTKLDLHLSAADTAQKALGLPPFQVEQLVVTSFSALATDPVDYAFWRDSFNERQHLFTELAKLPAPSAGLPPKPTPAAS